jgi:hypothetical protein
MKRKLSIIFLNIGMLVLMVAFNNCGQPGEIRFDQLSSAAPRDNSSNDHLDTGTNDPGVVNPPATIPPTTNPPTTIPPTTIPPTSSEPKLTKVEKTITLAETLKADILFVVDNSVSMEDEQANMSDRFPLFIKNLQQINWRVGVITTDIDDPNNSYSDGQLQKFSSGSVYLDAKIPEREAEMLFAGTIHRTESGSPYEQGIYATYRFLEREKKALAQFMRTDASINIVFLADADETPYEGTSGLPLIQKRNKPGELVKYLKANWPMKKFQFHSIVVNDGDDVCLGQSKNEGYGIAYETLSKQTNGVRGSVCAKDYGSQLQFMTEKIKDLVKALTLDCAPVYDSVAKKYRFDIKYDGDEKIEIEKIEDNIVYFKGGLPAGNIRLEYFCPSRNLSN